MELPQCSFRNGAGRRIVFCRHPDTPRTVTRDDCLRCELIDSDALPVEHAPQQVRCAHLGEKLHDEPCTCGSSTKIAVHACSLLDQRCSPDRHNKLPRDLQPHVLNCRSCSHRSSGAAQQRVDILYLRHAGNRNQDVPMGLKLLLDHGITAKVINVSRSTDLVQMINAHKPQLVINRGGCVTLKSSDELSRMFPQTTFVNGCHSTLSHLFLNRGQLQTWAGFWELARSRSNVWIASPDSRHPFDCDRSVTIPNPVALPAWGPPTRHETIAISLTGRRDFVKNFPNQIAAVAMVAKKHPVKLCLCIRGDSSELEHLASSLGIQIASRQWSGPEEFRKWIASDIDVGLCCSYSETFCYAALDHMVSGKPVIGGQGMNVIDKDLRADQDNPHDIAQRIDMAINSYGQFSRRARWKAEEIAAANNAEFVDAIRSFMVLIDKQNASEIQRAESNGIERKSR